MKDATKAVQDYYMDYAVSTITSRMFPFIDGLKPVQRKIIYSMGTKLKLTGGKDTKSSKVVGTVMGDLHPHGDASIYEALCNMSDFYEGLNAPIVTGSSLGKRWSDGDTVPAAASRYTEAGLTDFAKDVYLDGITENAVDMVPNYLNDDKEPMLLPAKIPTLIINSSKGIACGLSSYPPCYSLEGACNATIGLLRGQLHTTDDIAKSLGVPDFPTGGIVGLSQNQLRSLVESGETKGIVITSRYKMEKGNLMHITNIPFNTTVETIISQIKNLITNHNLQGISRVLNSTGNLKLGISIQLKRGVDPQEIFKILCTFTDVQKKISFHTKFVTYHMDEKTEEVFYDLHITGIRDLLENHWIPWRIDTKRRIYKYRLDKLIKEAEQIGAWLKIKDDIPGYLSLMFNTNRADAIEKQKAKFGLSDEEAKFLIGHNAYRFTVDEVMKQLAKYDENKRKQEEYNKLLVDDSLIREDIAKEIEEIRDKYSTERKSQIEGLNQVIHLSKEKKSIPDKEVYIGVTKNGYLKKAETPTEAGTLGDRVAKGDTLTNVFRMRNTDKLLVFTTHGYVYKLPVNMIDNGPKTKFKDLVWHIIDRDPEDKGEPFMFVPAADYSEEFNIFYQYPSDGVTKLAVQKIKTSNFRHRNVYKAVFPGFSEETSQILKEDAFLLITNKARALFVNTLKLSDVERTKKAFKELPSLPEGESIVGAIPYSEIEGFDSKIGLYSYSFLPISQSDFSLKHSLNANAENSVPISQASYTGEYAEEKDFDPSTLIDMKGLTIDDDDDYELDPDDYIDDEEIDY